MIILAFVLCAAPKSIRSILIDLYDMRRDSYFIGNIVKSLKIFIDIIFLRVPNERRYGGGLLCENEDSSEELGEEFAQTRSVGLR